MAYGTKTVPTLQNKAYTREKDNVYSTQDKVSGNGKENPMAERVPIKTKELYCNDTIDR